MDFLAAVVQAVLDALHFETLIDGVVFLGLKLGDVGDFGFFTIKTAVGGAFQGFELLGMKPIGQVGLNLD